jgi:glycosyltransferase involved in cell wall biosynthesis
MYCSTIIPTIARPTLARAVNSVLSQDFPADEFEVIVVNDSGNPLLAEDWQESDQVKVLTTQQRERSIARNTGAAIAKGNYLHFLDDDDWLLPGAFQAFRELSRRSEAQWLYGISQLVDRDGKKLIRLEHGLRGNCFTQIMAGEWIPLQSSLIRSDIFFQIDRFSPLLSGPEDIDLCRRIALQAGFDFTPKVVACIEMGQELSTTDYAQSIISARLSREAILDKAGVFNRLHSSAPTSELSGRIFRIYLTSAIWNIKHKSLSKAISRLDYAFISFMTSRKFLLRSNYWRAISQPYKSATFMRGFQKAGLPVSSR